MIKKNKYLFFSNFMLFLIIVISQSRLFANLDNSNNVPWINIFIHGTLFLTKKNNVNKRKSHYGHRIILGEGLTKIENPSKSLSTNLAAYPSIALFEKNNKKINPNDKNIYYLWGWNGILSNKARREESINLFCCLVKLINYYKKQGVNPKIRLLAHSHGGNVCLGIGRVWKELTSKKQEKLDFYDSLDLKTKIQKLSILSWKREIKRSSLLNQTINNIGGKEKIKNIKIGELVLFGMPIIEENSMFSSLPLFKNILSFYSYSDATQGIDRISTRGRSTLQRLDDKDYQQHKFYKYFTQVRMIVVDEKDNIGSKLERIPEKGASLKTYSKKIISRYFTKIEKKRAATLDPIHSDFWDMKIDKKNEFEFIRPMPIACFYPIIQSLINKALSKNINIKDFDCIIKKTKDCINFKLIPFNSSEEDSDGEQFKIDLRSWNESQKSMLDWFVFANNASLSIKQ